MATTTTIGHNRFNDDDEGWEQELRRMVSL